MGAEKSLKGAETIFLALLVIGLMGLLFLIIYGNLSGNLGFARVSLTVTNESENTASINIVFANVTGYTLNGTDYPGAAGYVITTVWSDGNQTNCTQAGIGNASSGYSISVPTTNLTVSSVGVITNASACVYPNLSVSYTNNYKGISERNTDSVIGNLTSGATQFFSFSSVWFILTAITILIGIVLGVIALVRKTGTSGMGKGKRESQFVS